MPAGWPALLWASMLWCVAALASDAGEADRWEALFAAVPALPATPAEAATMVSARTVLTEGLGIRQLRIEIADPGLRALQQQVDALHAPAVKAGADHMKRLMESANKDPAVTELARKLDKLWQPDPVNPGKLPSINEIREIERLLGPMPAPGSPAAAPRTEIGAYLLELQGGTPRARPLMQRIADQQRQFVKQHAQADREAIAQLSGNDVAAVARSVVARHQALALQQLADAQEVLREARNVFAPRVKRLAELARAAEQRNAPPVERNQAYTSIKTYVEFLLTIQRESVQDVGFWGGIRVNPVLPTPAQAGTHSLYELSIAPGFELLASGEQPYALPYYPLGREIVVGLLPGIR